MISIRLPCYVVGIGTQAVMIRFVLFPVKHNDIMKYVRIKIRIGINNVEQIFILVNICSMQFIFGVIYLPPNSPVQLYESHIF